MCGGGSGRQCMCPQQPVARTGAAVKTAPPNTRFACCWSDTSLSWRHPFHFLTNGPQEPKLGFSRTSTPDNRTTAEHLRPILPANRNRAWCGRCHITVQLDKDLQQGSSRRRSALHCSPKTHKLFFALQVENLTEEQKNGERTPL